MIEIILKNIQTIKAVHFKFEEAGVVQFFGQNSNGKSILAKVMSKVVFQQLGYDDKRLPLIRDGEECGTFGISWNGYTLIVYIHREVNKTGYQLIRPNGESVTRFARDKDGIPDLLKEFGFRIYGENDVCLQICETYGRMPFVNTSDETNEGIVNSVTTDEASEQFLVDHDKFHKEAKEHYKTAKTRLLNIQAELEKIELKNVTGMQEVVDRLAECCERAKYLKRIEHATLDLLPKLKFDLVKCEHIPNVPMLVHYQKAEYIPDVTEIFREMKKIREGVCPACGKPFIGGGEKCQTY